MRLRPYILFLLLRLLLASASSAWACGNGSTAACQQTSSANNCCTDQRAQSAYNTDKEDKGCCQENPGQKCPGRQHGGGCHCPCSMVAGNIASALLDSSFPGLHLLFIANDSTLRRAFYFAQHMPEAVYLPIWQPPKLPV